MSSILPFLFAHVLLLVEVTDASGTICVRYKHAMKASPSLSTVVAVLDAKKITKFDDSQRNRSIKIRVEICHMHKTQ